MEMIKRLPMRNILIFGIAAAALRMLAVFYNPYQDIYKSGSILLPVLVTIITVLPLALFFWVFWLRVSVPPLLRAGALTAAIGGSALLLFQIYCYFSWSNMVHRGYWGVSNFRLVAGLPGLAGAALVVGILLIGAAFLRNPNPKFFKGGLVCVIGSGIGCLHQILTLSTLLARSGLPSEMTSTINTLLTLATWVPVIIFFAFLLPTQPAPAPGPGRQPPVGGGSPYDGTPHY